MVTTDVKYLVTGDIKNLEIKKSLEQADSVAREVSYLGIAIGFYDAFLECNPEIDSVKQLKLVSKVNRDKFLNVLVEITITDLALLESMFNKIEDIKLNVVNRTKARPSYYGVYDALGLKEMFSQDLVEATDKNSVVLSTAITHAKLAYNKLFNNQDKE